MRRSFDIIGDIARIEADSSIEEKQLVKKITSTYPRIKAIIRKKSNAAGRYRVTKYTIAFKDREKVKASGLGTSETIHIEHGCRFKLDMRKVFFNPREATNREVIVSQVKPGEHVLVMLSGIAPYPIRIAKKVDCHVVGVELNPIAHEYAVENVKKNKVQENVKLIHGDVRTVKLKGTFDRIVIPLGVGAYRFLDVAFKYSKRGTIIHLYGRGEKKDPYRDIGEKVRAAAKKANKKATIVRKRVTLPYSPALDKVCIDVKVT